MTDTAPAFDSLIEIRDLSRGFGETPAANPVLRGACLRIRSGSFTVIRGPSGAGKTTLLRILGMLDQGYAGSFRFAGHELSGVNPGALDALRKDAIGFVFQEGRFLEHLTIGENIALPLRLRGIPGEAIETRLQEVADLVFRPEEISAGLLGIHPAQASGGQRQRSAVARAIITRPDLILADEPTASLDPLSREQIVEKLHDLHAQGVTVVVVSHDPVFFDHGDQYELRDGQLWPLSDSPGSRISSQPQRPNSPRLSHRTGWSPSLGFPTLVREALTSLLRRPLLSVLTLLSLVAGIVQVAILASLLGGVDQVIEQAVTDGSRLTRIAVRPRTADLQKDDRFPTQAAIEALPDVVQSVARRSASFAVVRQGGPETPYPSMGLHPDDPELKLFRFLAGTPDALAQDDFGILATPGFLSEVLGLAVSDAEKPILWAEILGRPIGIVVPRFDRSGQRAGVEPITLHVAGVILAGEGTRQFYVSNRLVVATDAIRRDRTGALQLPLTDDRNAWKADADLAPLLDWPWEDMLHVYVANLETVLPSLTALVGLGHRPEAEIWDYLWVLDLKQAALRIFLPMLGLLAVVISLVLIGNVYISARLRDAELALCRVLGMARGDLLAIEVLSLVLLTGFALAVGLSTAQGLINLLAAQFKAQAQLLAGLPEAGVSRMTGELFMPVTAVAGPIIAITLGLVVLSIIWPSLRVANTDPAKVFTRS